MAEKVFTISREICSTDFEKGLLDEKDNYQRLLGNEEIQTNTTDELKSHVDKLEYRGEKL